MDSGPQQAATCPGGEAEPDFQSRHVLAFNMPVFNKY